MKVENKIKEEIAEGNYIISKTTPLKTSALAAIPKSDGDIRLIHDFSRPEGYSVNDFAQKDHCAYQSLNDAIKLLSPSAFIAKVDLKAAYRSVPIKTMHHTLTGLRWTFSGDRNATNIVDRMLGFGLRKRPSVFNRITQSVTRMMHRRGFNCTCYLDDFFLCEDSFDACAKALATLISLLRSLNFRINWKKVVDPCRKMTFLGVQIDLDQARLTLDPEKATDLCALLQETSNKSRLSKAFLQLLAGKLVWASQVHQWGRWHIAPFFHTIATLQGQRHRARLSVVLKQELQWRFDVIYNSSNSRHIWHQAKQAQQHIATDSSTVGGGVFHVNYGLCYYANWLLDNPTLGAAHINIKELAIIQQAVRKYAHLNPGSHLSIYTDNKAACGMLNKGYSSNRTAAALLRDIAICASRHDCSLSAHFIPGSINHIPDAISRLHQPGQWQRLNSLLRLRSPPSAPMCEMTHMSYSFLVQLWMKRWHKVTIARTGFSNF